MGGEPRNGRAPTGRAGALRETHVRVGRHIAPEPAELPAFLERFVAAYGSGSLGRLRRIIAVALPIIGCSGSTLSSTATAGWRGCSHTPCYTN